ncbi:MAG TPA: MFS transporter [Daejeonella sp.]|uniref:MFS transporter n=1 Tax=Daejeonella sp. TaxID=2805397 RepID=UPI002ED7E580
MYRSRLVFFAACLGMLLFGIGLITLGSVATGLKAKFSLDDLSTGSLFSILPIGILTGSLIFGPLCDKYGYKVFLIISCLLMFTGFQGIAHTASISLLKMYIFLFGLACGAINGVANAVVSDISLVNKRSNLSLLGVFFAIGALGMPLILGVLENLFSFSKVISYVSFLTLIATVFFISIRFPPPKQLGGLPLLKGIKLIQDQTLILISLFLFCQSSFEGIINNWTTSYLIGQLSISQNKALFALSLYVAGMAVMRLLIISIFRNVKSPNILIISFFLLFLGCTFLKAGQSFPIAVSGLILIGAGLAAGFPVMLGIVGARYSDLSATAFSFVLVTALLGNMMVNYLMGMIAQIYGIKHLTTVAYFEIALMVVLTFTIIKKLNYNTIKKQ